MSNDHAEGSDLPQTDSQHTYTVHHENNDGTTDLPGGQNHQPQPSTSSASSNNTRISDLPPYRPPPAKPRSPSAHLQYNKYTVVASSSQPPVATTAKTDGSFTSPLAARQYCVVDQNTSEERQNCITTNGIPQEDPNANLQRYESLGFRVNSLNRFNEDRVIAYPVQGNTKTSKATVHKSTVATKASKNATGGRPGPNKTKSQAKKVGSTGPSGKKSKTIKTEQSSKSLSSPRKMGSQDSRSKSPAAKKLIKNNGVVGSGAKKKEEDKLRKTEGQNVPNSKKVAGPAKTKNDKKPSDKSSTPRQERPLEKQDDENDDEVTSADEIEDELTNRWSVGPTIEDDGGMTIKRHLSPPRSSGRGRKVSAEVQDDSARGSYSSKGLAKGSDASQKKPSQPSEGGDSADEGTPLQVEKASTTAAKGSPFKSATAIPRTPPKESSNQPQNYGELEMPPPPLTPPMQQQEEVGEYGFNVSMEGGNDANAIQARLIRCFEMCCQGQNGGATGGNGTFRRPRRRCCSCCCGCGGGQSVKASSSILSPCSCQSCRVYHYCMNMLNRNNLKPNEQMHETNAANSIPTQQQKINLNPISADKMQGGGTRVPSRNCLNNPEGYKDNLTTTTDGGSGPYTQGSNRQYPVNMDRWKTEYSTQFIDFTDFIKNSYRYRPNGQGYNNGRAKSGAGNCSEGGNRKGQPDSKMRMNGHQPLC